MIDKLLKLLKIKFAGEIPLKDGTMIIVDGDMVAGASVYVQSPDGQMPLPDGDYELETGQILSAKDGKIEAITDVVDTEETPDSNGQTPVGEITVEVDNAKAPPMETPPATEEPTEPEPEPKKDETMVKVEEMIAKMAEMEQRMKDLEDKLMMKSEEDVKLRADLDFIKTKTTSVELKKSKDINDAPLSRLDVIKNLKNNK